MKKIKKIGPIKSILDKVYSLPQVIVSEAQIRHEIDKASGKSGGILSLKLEVDRPAPKNRDDFLSCVIVLGTWERRMLLAQAEVSVGRSSKKTFEKQIKFDWDAANADAGEGGGMIHLRILLDSVRGMDLEMSVKLQ